MSRRLVLCALVAAVAAVSTGCGDDDSGRDPMDPPDPPPRRWLVGAEGTMLRLDSAADIGGYDLGLTSDLLDIDCRGATDAFAVGADGVALRTFDAGESWDRMELGEPATTTTLRAVAAAAWDVVYAVGDGGELWHSSDSGAHWQRRLATADLTDVDTTPDGATAYATSEDGSVWRFRYRSLRYGHDTLVKVREGDGSPLWSVATDATGELVVAVGWGREALWSRDGGRSWEPTDLGTDAEIYAVRLAADGDVALAVGQAGTIARWESTGDVEVSEWLEPDRDLRGLHVSHDGRGVAVGDRGAAFETLDFGGTWLPLHLDVLVDLHGVDDLHAGPHF